MDEWRCALDADDVGIYSHTIFQGSGPGYIDLMLILPLEVAATIHLIPQTPCCGKSFILAPPEGISSIPPTCSYCQKVWIQFPHTSAAAGASFQLSTLARMLPQRVLSPTYEERDGNLNEATRLEAALLPYLAGVLPFYRDVDSLSAHVLASHILEESVALLQAALSANLRGELA